MAEAEDIALPEGEEVPFRALEDAQGLLGVLKRLFGGR